MVKEKAESEKFKRITITIAPDLYSAVNEKIKKGELSGVITSLLKSWVSNSESVITDMYQCVSETNTPEIPPEWISSINNDIENIKTQIVQNEKDVQSMVNDSVMRAFYGEVPDASVNLQPVIERIEALEKSQNTELVKVLLLDMESLKNRMTVLEEIYDEGNQPEEMSEAVAYPGMSGLNESLQGVSSVVSDVSQVRVISESVPERSEPVPGDEGDLSQDNGLSKGRKELFKDRIDITPEMKDWIFSRFKGMKDAGFSKARIAEIMGFKRSTSISEIESGKCSTISKQGYEALMNWSP